MTYELTPEQITRIEYLATDQWVVDDDSADAALRSRQKFDQAIGQMSSVELHHFACNFNWDCGVDELKAVIDHPACDAGTALMIYWLAQPASQFRMALKTKTSEETNDIVRLLRTIELKMEQSAFQTSVFACDPTNIMGQSLTNGSDRDRAVVPARMFVKINGVEIVPHCC